MIARLKGLLESQAEDGLVIDVGGVGYQVFCSAATLRRLPRPGEALVLEIETHVREDHIHLYGFTDTGEREWFRTLQTVQGVGARLALGILSALTPAELGQAVAAQDHAALTRANGVGAKLGKRIVAELRDRVPAAAMGLTATPGAATAAGGSAADAVSALVNLGYGRSEAFAAVAAAAAELGAEPEAGELIKAGLKELAP
ncbi:MAG TPA: Holliday junction branch migration protein RuvA [Alphaproteobacteria bacterium]|jgi:Holliday junction DNA helicase RuvA|nr:Holliday junction branch migration protein RuvA [Alphaproteobacteria bacterium]MDP6270258.1 Holliday junction branch migration protein RuvA [Alphaproteobacteria bacterium]MDP7164362.1 Holliday junction branch migration protein RuvA [Alphaproteobacteria bacterium]MDP7428790.1 Holliday junction branch migration protein RuvA [Alphaproteobacteria bacterium]HJM51801.1 Holliday junction branch migration protein RuvA [Alphaproteobacteria bacterium]